MENKIMGKKKEVVVAAVVVSLLFCFLMFRQKADTYEDDFFDPAAVTGILPGMSEAEIQAELNRIVEEGMLNIAIASEIRFADGQSQGLANIKNVEANHYIFKVAVTLDETGEMLYESGGIRPGQYIRYIDLEKKLDTGEHEATAVFTAYTQDTRQIAGSASAKLLLFAG